MPNKKNVNELIDVLCLTIGCAPMRLNEENVCAFSYRNESKELDVTLHYSEENKLITLLSLLTPLTLDSDRDLAMLKSLLIFCFPGFASKGSSISINPYENKVVLTYQVLSSSNLSTFYNVFVNFIDTALSIIEHLKKTEQLIDRNEKNIGPQNNLLINRRFDGLSL
jgi:hypothetical protein